MKIKMALIILLLAATIACRKEKESNNCRITKITKNGTDTYQFIYGDNGKISSMLALPSNENSVYEYNGNEVTITTTKNGGFRYRLIVTNNNNGLAENILLQQNQSGSDWFNQAITYEGKNVVRNHATNSGGDSATGNYIWEEGNPTVFLNEGDIVHYEYYKEKNYQAGDWRNIQQLITGYKLYEYKNLFKMSETNGNMTYYTYLYDGQGRITEATSSTKTFTTTYTLEYECQ